MDLVCQLAIPRGSNITYPPEINDVLLHLTRLHYLTFLLFITS